MRSDAAFIKREFETYIRKDFTSAEYRTRAARIAWVGEVVSAYIVQANFNLYQRGTGMDYPCLVLMTFDPAHTDDRAFMQPIVQKLQSLKGTRPMDADLAAAAKIVTDEVAVRDRRVLLPPSLTGGVTVYAVDLQLYRARLATGTITDGEVVCIAEPGPEGSAEQVPYWIAMGMTAAQGQSQLSSTSSRPLSERLNALPSSVFDSRQRFGSHAGLWLIIPLLSILGRAAYWSAHSTRHDDDDSQTGYTEPVAPQTPDPRPPDNYSPTYTPSTSTYTAPPVNQPGPYTPSNAPYMSGRRFPGSFGVNRPGMPGYQFGPRRSPYFAGPGSSVGEPPNPYAGIKLPPGGAPQMQMPPPLDGGGYTPPDPSTQSTPDTGAPPPSYGGQPPPDYQQSQSPPSTYGNGDRAPAPPPDQSDGQGMPQYPPADGQPPQ